MHLVSRSYISTYIIYLSQDFPTAAVVSCHLLPGVDPLAEHDGAVGAVPQRLQGHVSVHGPHGGRPRPRHASCCQAATPLERGRVARVRVTISALAVSPWRLCSSSGHGGKSPTEPRPHRRRRLRPRVVMAADLAARQVTSHHTGHRPNSLSSTCFIHLSCVIMQVRRGGGR